MNARKILNFIRGHLAILIPIALALGLLKGHWYPMEYSRAICISALLVMIFPVFINLEFDKGLKEFGASKAPLFAATIVNFILYPALAYGLGWIFLREHPAMWLGLVLLSLVPTSGMTINWTYFTKGNMHAVMAIVSGGIIIAVLTLPFTVPFFTQHLMHGQAENLVVDKEVIIEKLFFIIIIPVIVGWIVRKQIIKRKGYDFFKSIKPINGGISACGVTIVSFLVMSLRINQDLFNKPDQLVLAVVPVALFYAVMFLVSHFLGHLLFADDTAKPFFFGTAARYHVITLGVVLGTFKDYDFLGQVTLLVALGLAIQIPALAFYARYINGRDARRAEQGAQTREPATEKEVTA